MKGLFLAFEGNFHLARCDEVHGMRIVPFADNDLSRLRQPAPAVKSMTSEISAASTAANSGTLEIMPQVTMKSRRWICSAKAVAMMPTGGAISTSPAKIVTVAINFAKRGHRHHVPP